MWIPPLEFAHIFNLIGWHYRNLPVREVENLIFNTKFYISLKYRDLSSDLAETQTVYTSRHIESSAKKILSLSFRFLIYSFKNRDFMHYYTINETRGTVFLLSSIFNFYASRRIKYELLIGKRRSLHLRPNILGLLAWTEFVKQRDLSYWLISWNSSAPMSVQCHFYAGVFNR